MRTATSAAPPMLSLGESAGMACRVPSHLPFAILGETPSVPMLPRMRADRLLSTRALVKQVRVGPGSISLTEARRGMPGGSPVRRLATALGVDPKAVDECRQAIEATEEVPPTRGRTAQDQPQAGRARSGRMRRSGRSPCIHVWYRRRIGT